MLGSPAGARRAAASRRKFRAAPSVGRLVSVGRLDGADSGREAGLESWVPAQEKAAAAARAARPTKLWRWVAIARHPTDPHGRGAKRTLRARAAPRPAVPRG